MRGRNVCHIHGGKSTGAPKGERNGNFKFGLHTNDIVEFKREMAGIIRAARQQLKGL